MAVVLFCPVPLCDNLKFVLITKFILYHVSSAKNHIINLHVQCTINLLTIDLFIFSDHNRLVVEAYQRHTVE